MDLSYITSRFEIGKLLEDIYKAEEIGLDVETTSLDPFTSTLLLVQLEVNNNIYVLDVRRLGKDVVKYIISLLVESKKLFIGHNIKFDAKIIFANFNERLEKLYDTMLGEVLINQGMGRQFYSYADVVETYCGARLDKSERETFINYTGEITNEQINYSALDVKYLKEIKRKQIEILKNQGQNATLELEMSVEFPITSMELNGVALDLNQWEELKQVAIDKKAGIEKQIKDEIFNKIDYSKFGNAFEFSEYLKIPVATKKLRVQLEGIKNPQDILSFAYENIDINSHTQMLAIMKNRGLDIESTGEKVIKSFSDKDSVVKLLLDYREQEKLRSTYGDTLVSEIHPITHRFHAEYNQLGATTGRFSASRIHQIPRSNLYRKAFIARKGFKLITADYSQQEYRIVGAVSTEPRIIEAYLYGMDMHTATASIIFNVKMDEVSKDQRYFGKTFNFAVIYGTSKWGLARNLGIKLDEGERLLDIFWDGYPVLHGFKSDAEQWIWDHKMSKTPMGRKRYFQDRTLFVDNLEYVKYQSRVKREGFNHIIQGCGADIIKIAMRDMYYKNPFKDKFYLYLQAHDEIVVEAEDSIVNDAKDFMEHCMLEAEQPFLGVIPAKVDIVIGDCWMKG